MNSDNHSESLMLVHSYFIEFCRCCKLTRIKITFNRIVNSQEKIVNQNLRFSGGLFKKECSIFSKSGFFKMTTQSKIVLIFREVKIIVRLFLKQEPNRPFLVKIFQN